MNLRTKTINGIKWTSISAGIVGILSLLRVVILTRLVEKEAFGLFAIITILIGFSNLFIDLGVSVGILHRQSITNNEYNSLYSMTLLIGIGLILIILPFSYAIANYYSTPELVELMPFISIIIMINVAGAQHKLIRRKNLEFKFIESIEVLAIILAFILAIVLAVMKFEIYALVYSFLIQVVIANGIFIFYGFANRNFKFRLRLKELKPFLSIGIYQCLGQIVNYISSQIDVIIIGKALGMNTLGGYSLAKNLADRPKGFINPIINKVAAPVFSRLQDDTEKLDSGYLKTIRFLSFVLMPVYANGVVLAEVVIGVVYGNDFKIYSSVFACFCIYMYFRSVINPIGNLVIAKGATRLEFFWNLLVLITLPTTIIALSSFGIMAVSAGMTILMIIYFVSIYLVIIKKLTRINFRQYISTLKYGLMASIPIILVGLVLIKLISNPVIIIAVNISVSAVVWMVIVIYFGNNIDRTMRQRCLKLLKI